MKHGAFLIPMDSTDVKHGDRRENAFSTIQEIAPKSQTFGFRFYRVATFYVSNSTYLGPSKAASWAHVLIFIYPA